MAFYFQERGNVKTKLYYNRRFASKGDLLSEEELNDG